MKYTLYGGYDRQIKKRVEKGTLFAVPLAVLGIIGLASLTSNITRGPGTGGTSSGSGGTSTVIKSLDTNSGQLTSSTTPATQGAPASQAAAGASSANSAAAGSSANSVAQSTSRVAAATTSGTTSTISQTHPSTTTPTVTTPQLPSTGSSGGGTTTIVPPSPIPTPPITICTKDPLLVTGQTTLCVN